MQQRLAAAMAALRVAMARPQLAAMAVQPAARRRVPLPAALSGR